MNIFKSTRKNLDGEVDYTDFLEAMREFKTDSDETIGFARQILPKLTELKYKNVLLNKEEYSYAMMFHRPIPRLFMILVSICQTILFLYHLIHLSSEHNKEITWIQPIPKCSYLIYDPFRRHQAWRVPMDGAAET